MSSGLQLGVDVVDAGLRRDRGCGAVVVAGQHRPRRSPDASAARRLRRLRGGSRRGRRQRRAALRPARPGRRSHPRPAAGRRRRRGVPLSTKPGLPEPRRVGVDRPGQALAGHGLTSHACSAAPRPSAAARIAAASGCSLRVSSAAATARTRSRRDRGGGGDDLDHGGLVAGEGAGLVERDGADRAERFDRGAALDEDAARDAAPIAAMTATGTLKAKAHGRGRDEHDQGTRDPHARGRRGALPSSGDEGGQDKHTGDERPGDPFGEPLAGALALLRLLDDADEPGQRVVRGGRGHLDLERAGAVDGAGEHGRAGPTSTGTDSPVTTEASIAAPAAAHHAVGGDLLPGRTAGRRRRRGQPGRPRPPRAAAQDRRRRRSQAEQRPQAVAGPGQGVVLQRLGDREQERQRRGLRDLARITAPTAAIVISSPTPSRPCTSRRSATARTSPHPRPRPRRTAQLDQGAGPERRPPAGGRRIAPQAGSRAPARPA